MSGLAIGGFTGGRGQREADRDDERAVLVDQARDVRSEVGLGVGLDGDVLDAQLFGCGLEALEAELVERLVVEPARVGDHARLEAVDGAARCGGFAGGRLGCRPAAGKGYEQSGGGNDPDELLSGGDCQLTPP